MSRTDLVSDPCFVLLGEPHPIMFSLPNDGALGIEDLTRRREEKLGPCPATLAVDISPMGLGNVFTRTFTNTWSMHEEVEAHAAARASMSWKQLAESTLQLGTRHPMLLLQVRNFEEHVRRQAVARDVACFAANRKRLHNKRRRVVKALAGGVKLKSSDRIMMVNQDGAGVESISRRTLQKRFQNNVCGWWRASCGGRCRNGWRYGLRTKSEGFRNASGGD